MTVKASQVYTKSLSMETLLLMNDELNQAKVVLNRLFQACDNHHKLYPRVEEASEAEWEIWLKIGRSPPKNWSPSVITEWREKGVQSYHCAQTSFFICKSLFGLSPCLD